MGQGHLSSSQSKMSVVQERITVELEILASCIQECPDGHLFPEELGEEA